MDLHSICLRKAFRSMVTFLIVHESIPLPDGLEVCIILLRFSSKSSVPIQPASAGDFYTVRSYIAAWSFDPSRLAQADQCSLVSRQCLLKTISHAPDWEFCKATSRLAITSAESHSANPWSRLILPMSLHSVYPVLLKPTVDFWCLQTSRDQMIESRVRGFKGSTCE